MQLEQETFNAFRSKILCICALISGFLTGLFEVLGMETVEVNSFSKYGLFSSSVIKPRVIRKEIWWVFVYNLVGFVTRFCFIHSMKLCNSCFHMTVIFNDTKVFKSILCRVRSWFVIFS